MQHKVGDTVWPLVKGIQKVKYKVQKFLPAYEGPYLLVGDVLDDLVYLLQGGPRVKVKVVHKLKPYPSQVPLDSSCSPCFVEGWAPVEVSPPLLNPDPLDVGPLNLWVISSGTDSLVQGPISEAASPEVGLEPGRQSQWAQERECWALRSWTCWTSIR